MSALSHLEDWFASRGWTPFGFQREVWDAYRAGESGLVHAATGTGKTLAAWMGPLLEWLEEYPGATAPAPSKGRGRAAAPPLRVLWITPLRALATDTAHALAEPLEALGIPWTLETRTGDTPERVRARQRARLPTALVTTPESLSLLLSREDAPTLFEELRLVVVDEWHELMGTKRGVQVELALSRLRAWRPALRTWGLSATLGNLEDARDTLLGVGRAGPSRIVRGVEPKQVVIDALIPPRIERFPWAGHLGTQMLPQVAEAIEEGESAIVFTNTRSQTEIWYQALLEARPEWAGLIALHHGSLDRKTRDWVEDGLRAGRLRCVVATSSLDLGVDFSPVDRVLQVGSPKGVARLLQRAGRSGHRPGAASRVTCVPTHALELVEVAAARDGVEAGAMESRLPAERPLDVLVQHVVTAALGGGARPEDLLAEVRSTRAYAGLRDDEWAWVLDFVRHGGQVLGAYPEYSRVVERDGLLRVEDREVARRHRMAIGTIVGDAQVTVQYVRGARLGSVEESFVARLKPGDRFVFAGKPLEFVRVRDMKAWVRRTTTSRGTVPRWMGSRLSLSSELAAALRARLGEAARGIFRGPEMEAVRPILEVQARWSRVPAADELLVERVRTREGHHLFFFPFEGRLVHEGMAALFAYRMSRLRPISFTLSASDYGFELLSPDPAPLEEALAAGLLDPGGLLDDIPASLNATEMARRQFREIARVAGLVFPGYRHAGKTARQLQASSGLFFDVFQRYDPENLLLSQAHREVLERQLESSRLGRAMHRLRSSRVVLTEPERTPPLAFPLLVDRARESVSSETLADRVRRMQIALERAAG
ncbi:MAG TPA: ligase-associated DNA damage response DEXH box helicase [Longimicrobiaceae bacterium]|nr:ligase-associated DNA damage response DEXH box helicase [Longimicrobiaceae bacterium]